MAPWVHGGQIDGAPRLVNALVERCARIASTERAMIENQGSGEMNLEIFPPDRQRPICSGQLTRECWTTIGARLCLHVNHVAQARASWVYGALASGRAMAAFSQRSTTRAILSDHGGGVTSEGGHVRSSAVSSTHMLSSHASALPKYRLASLRPDSAAVS